MKVHISTNGVSQTSPNPMVVLLSRKLLLDGSTAPPGVIPIVVYGNMTSNYADYRHDQPCRKQFILSDLPCHTFMCRHGVMHVRVSPSKTRYATMHEHQFANASARKATEKMTAIYSQIQTCCSKPHTSWSCKDL